MQPNVWVYILQCADGTYYVGKYQGQALENRVSEHNAATYPDAYTARRRPVELLWSAWFPRFDDAVQFEQRLKGWSRAKKEALMRGDEAALKTFSARGFRPSTAFALRDASLRDAPQGEGSSDFAASTKSLHPEEARSAVTKGEGTRSR